MPSELHRTQLQFTAYLRNPQAAPCPRDVPARRMQAYRELLTNNVESAVSACFPVLRGLIGDARWQSLVAAFFEKHQCHSPVYREIPAEFLAWLEEAPLASLEEQLPFMQELAHYEWMELALDIDPTEIPEAGIDPAGDLLAGVPVLNPLTRLLAYQFPVHRIGPDFIPMAPGPAPTLLAMVRRRDHGIGFLEINPLVAHLIELLSDNHARTGAELLDGLHSEFPSVPAATFRTGGQRAFNELAQHQIVLGTRP